MLESSRRLTPCTMFINTWAVVVGVVYGEKEEAAPALAAAAAAAAVLLSPTCPSSAASSTGRLRNGSPEVSTLQGLVGGGGVSGM